MNGTPQQVADGILDSVVEGARGAGNSAAQALDQPLQQAGIPAPGPHRMLNRFMNGVWDSVKVYGQGVVNAMNVPYEALGIPPDLGGGGGGGRIKFPTPPRFGRM